MWKYGRSKNWSRVLKLLEGKLIRKLWLITNLSISLEKFWHGCLAGQFVTCFVYWHHFCWLCFSYFFSAVWRARFHIGVLFLNEECVRELNRIIRRKREMSANFHCFSGPVLWIYALRWHLFRANVCFSGGKRSFCRKKEDHWSKDTKIWPVSNFTPFL